MIRKLAATLLLAAALASCNAEVETPPIIISDVAVEQHATSVLLSWTTSKNSACVTNAAGSTFYTLGYEHAVEVVGLEVETSYSYAIAAEVAPGVHHIERGRVLTLRSQGRDWRCLFMGGAESIDAPVRTPGFDWFPEELITQRELDTALASIEEYGGVDAVFSHTCPVEFGVLDHREDKRHDPSRRALSAILEVARPRLWYFGHWHVRKSGEHGSTQWTCLNYAPLSGWWTYLGERAGV